MREELVASHRVTRGKELKAGSSPPSPLSPQQLTFIHKDLGRQHNLPMAAPNPLSTLMAMGAQTITTLKPHPGTGKKPVIHYHPSVQPPTTDLAMNPPSPTANNHPRPNNNVGEHDHANDEDEDETSEIDLADYPPPDILTKVPDADAAPNETLIMILQSSIDNIIHQLNAEKLRRIEAQREAELQAAAEAQQGKGKGKGKAVMAPIPIIQVTDEGQDSPGKASSPHEEDGQGSSAGSLHRRSRFGIRRILNQIIDRPESGSSSAAGSEASESRENLSPSSGDASASQGHSLHRFIKKHTKPSTTDGPSADSETIECIACFSDIPSKSAIRTPCHPYCPPCFTLLISTALETEAQWPPKCCLNTIPYRTIAKHTPPPLLRQYKSREAEYKIPLSSRLYCSHPNCGQWIRKFDKATSTARCSRGHAMCVMCRAAPHRGVEACPQDRDLQLLDEMAEESGWRRCYQCRAMVEHKEACAHMTCRCGAQFCYVCGGRWRTCACTGDGLRRVKARAEARRMEREVREREREREEGRVRVRQEEEDEWLRGALRLIEEYESEERARREEEEERRRREVERRYNELLGDLMDLEDWQRGVLLGEQTREGDECRIMAIDERNLVWDRLVQEREGLREAMAAKVEDYELEWENEYRVRVAWEKELEDEYTAVLKEFWADKVGGQEHMTRALHKYLKKNDARRDAWWARRDHEVRAFRHAAEEELKFREEFTVALIEREDKVAEKKQVEVRRKHRAELRWFELAVSERRRLLAEMETVERENGGESEAASWMSLTDDEVESIASEGS